MPITVKTLGSMGLGGCLDKRELRQKILCQIEMKYNDEWEWYNVYEISQDCLMLLRHLGQMCRLGKA